MGVRGRTLRLSKAVQLTCENGAVWHSTPQASLALSKTPGTGIDSSLSQHPERRRANQASNRAEEKLEVKRRDRINGDWSAP